MHLVQCRACRQQFDIDSVPAGSWLIPEGKSRAYYHTACFNNCCSLNDVDDTRDKDDTDFWLEATYNFLVYYLKVKVDYVKLKLDFSIGQRQGKHPKGIYLATRYAYSIKHLSWEKANNHLGILISKNSTIYQEASQYYVNHMALANQVLAEVTELRELKKQKQIERHIKAKAKRNKNIINIDEIGESE